VRVALIGCGKRKGSKAVRAKDLYTGPLFALARRYAERRCDAFLILSAKHGVVDPDRVLGPYEQSMGSLTRAERAEWARLALARVTEVARRAEIVFLAGSDYEGAVDGLSVEAPLRGLSIGARMKWLKENA